MVLSRCRKNWIFFIELLQQIRKGFRPLSGPLRDIEWYWVGATNIDRFYAPFCLSWRYGMEFSCAVETSNDIESVQRKYRVVMSWWSKYRKGLDSLLALLEIPNGSESCSKKIVWYWVGAARMSNGNESVQQI